MKNALAKSAVIVISGLVAAVAWAAEGPIGSLTIKGKATITAQESTFTLQDQEYAYFSNDRIETNDSSQALVVMTSGLKVALDASSAARILEKEGTYTIDLQQGSMAVDAPEGSDYRLAQNGEAISGSEKFAAKGEPYVVSVSDTDEARVYVPAQMEEEGERRGLLLFLGGAAGGAGYFFSQDDSDPSS